MSEPRSFLRALSRDPWSTVALVVTLGIGIGVSTAVYAVFNHALLRPVPGIADSDRLVHLVVGDESTNIAAPMAHFAAARAVPVFDGLAGFADPPSVPVVLGAGSAAEVANVVSVTRGYFEVLGVRAAAGRLFQADEYEMPGTLLAVISEPLWRRSFGGGSNVVGATIHVGDRPFTIVGVARQFRGPSRIGNQDIWVPWGAGSLREAPVGRQLTSVGTIVGRLAPGVRHSEAASNVAAAFDHVGPIRRGSQTATTRVLDGLPGPTLSARTELQTTLWFASAGALLLLVLACANAASQLILRNAKRQRELAVRNALGASRSRLLCDLLTEVGLISLSAAAVGVAVGAGVRAAVATFELRGSVPLAEVSLDWRVTAAAIAVSAVTAILAGLGPSLMAMRADPLVVLRRTGPGIPGSGWTGRGLVVIQLALSLVLVACAGLFSQSMSRLHAIDLGFQADGLLLLDDSVRPTSVGHPREDAPRFHAELRRRLSETPGIESAAYSGGSPLGNVAATARVAASAEPKTIDAVPVREISSDYFRTMGIPLLAGRDFTHAEGAGSSLAGHVVINELLAVQLFGVAPPIGRRISIEPSWLLPGTRRSAEVIGVVGATVAGDVRQGHRVMLFVAAGERTTAIHQVRTSLSIDQARATVLRVVRDMEPRLAVGRLVTPHEQLDAIAVDTAILGRASLVFAVLAALLSLSGAYTVTARTVAERTREYGIRMALGSSPMALARIVLTRALATASVGLIIGVAIYIGVFQLLEAWLFGISARDPLTMVLGCAAMVAATVAAAWPAASRAMRVDPCLSLRAE